MRSVSSRRRRPQATGSASWTPQLPCPTPSCAARCSTRPRAHAWHSAENVSDSGGAPEAVLGMDVILDDIMLYWLPNAGASSARIYWEAARSAA